MSLALLRETLSEAGPRVSPFLVLGDPTPEISVELAAAAVRGGAGLLELGLPYSDPCADGPAIQGACRRAFAASVSTTRALSILGEIHARCPRTPLNLLVYGNLVHARGYDRFCEEAAALGASTLLVPDIPLEECGPLSEACARHGLGQVQLVGPRTPPARLARIDAAADGFLYLAAHQGITGGPAAADRLRTELVSRTVRGARNPICLGFGLSRREHLEQAFAAGARIAVIGSHLVRAIEQAWRAEERSTQTVVESFMRAFEPLVQAAGPAASSPTSSEE